MLPLGILWLEVRYRYVAVSSTPCRAPNQGFAGLTCLSMLPGWDFALLEPLIDVFLCVFFFFICTPGGARVGCLRKRTQCSKLKHKAVSLTVPCLWGRPSRVSVLGSRASVRYPGDRPCLTRPMVAVKRMPEAPRARINQTPCRRNVYFAAHFGGILYSSRWQPRPRVSSSCQPTP